MYPFKLCKVMLLVLHRQLRAEGTLRDGEIGAQALFDNEVLEGKSATYVDVRSGEEIHSIEHAKLDMEYSDGDGQQ